MASDSRRHSIVAFCALAVVTALIVGLSIDWRVSKPALVDAPASVPPPPPASSPFLNTKGNVSYIGSDGCRECHAAQSEGYKNTWHDRAFADIAIDQEPPDGEFPHPKSGRVYRVVRRDGELRHQEILPAGRDGPEIVLADFAVRRRVGSGHNARTYLAEVDGFLVESPITWFESAAKWDISPGYDRLDHSSFSRVVGVECLQCHTGHIATETAETDKVRFHERSIGCESCHGPGSLHAERRSAGAGPSTGIDVSIVNPSRLPRALAEAVCARCHVSGAAVAFVRGREMREFRPGLPLNAYRIDYRLDRPDETVTVTSHFQQLSDSLCYRRSESLTCTTCHDPHGVSRRGSESAPYRAVCLSCHTGAKGCAVAEETRIRTSASDDCASCHMPRRDTQVPHVAFTNHRISRPREEPKSASVAASHDWSLAPIGASNDVLSTADRDRCLALALLHLAETLDDADSEEPRRDAFRLLEDGYRGGLRDARLTVALGWLHWERRSERFEALALETLRASDCANDSRINALSLLAAGQVQKNAPGEAAKNLEALIRIRAGTNAWSQLGECRQRSGDLPGASQAYRKAIETLPLRPDVHFALAEIHKSLGDEAKSREHRRLAERFVRLIQRVDPQKPPVEN